MFPTIVLYLSSFYTRKELSLRYGSHDCHSSVDHPYHDWSSRIALFFSAASVSYKILSDISLALKFTLSSRVLFLGCLLLQLKKWMASVEDKDGPGSSLSYAWEAFRVSLKSSTSYIGRIIFNCHWPPWFLRYSLDTIRFQVFDWEPEMASLYRLYTALHALTSTMFSIIMRRLERDRQSIKMDDKFTFKEMLRSACSPHVIMIFIMFFMSGTMLFGLAFFLPSIVGQLGFSATKSQLLSVGPYAVGFFGEFFFFSYGATYYQDLCTTCFPSDFNFCVLVRPLWSKRYNGSPYLSVRHCWFRSLSR